MTVPLVVDNSIDDSGDNTPSILLAAGVLSDTHLLAKMYAGELCFFGRESNLLTPVLETHKSPTIIKSCDSDIASATPSVLDANMHALSVTG